MPAIFEELAPYRMPNTPSAPLRNLAQRLLAAEAASPSAAQSHLPVAVRVCEKLRISLTRFAGADGFTSLLRRSLTLARMEFPAVQNIKIKVDGSLEGLEELATEANGGGNEVAQAAIAITAHLLGLLVTFVGEPITLRLVREAWPDALLHE